MINLIPPEGLKAVKREYLMRVGVTLGFLFGCVLLLLTVALVPTYVLINAQIKAFELEAERNNSAGNEFEEADKDVRRAADLLAQLRSTAERPKASGIIKEIQRHATAGIFFKTFYIVEKQGTIENIQVQGSAPTRESLASLKSSLESSDMFEKVELPIADLARDTDLPFALTITLAKTN